MADTKTLGSILDSTKHKLGIESDYTDFDVDIIISINSAFATLFQVADIGAPTGFRISDKSDAWEDVLLDDPRLESVKDYIYFKSRLSFDPPTTSFALDAVTKQITELEWRLSLYAPPASYSSS